MSKKTKSISSSNEDFIDHLTYGTYAKVAAYIPHWITPNQLTWANFVCAMIACWGLILVEANWILPVSALFLYLFTFFDALDGIHARLSGQLSKFGHFPDHFLDGFTWLFLYFAVIVHFSLWSPFLIFLLMLRMLMQSFAYLTESVTGHLHLPRLGPTCEVMGYCAGFVVTFFYPENFSISFLHDVPYVSDFLARNDLLELTVMKVLLLGYIVGLPPAILNFYQQAYLTTKG